MDKNVLPKIKKVIPPSIISGLCRDNGYLETFQIIQNKVSSCPLAKVYCLPHHLLFSHQPVVKITDLRQPFTELQKASNC